MIAPAEMKILPKSGSPSDAANPNAAAKSTLRNIANPKRAKFLDETPMAIVYIEAVSVIVLSLTEKVNHSSSSRGSRGIIMCRMTQKAKFCHLLDNGGVLCTSFKNYLCISAPLRWHLNLAGAYLVVGGVYDGAVAAAGAAAHDDDDVVRLAGAAAEDPVVALALGALGDAEAD